jgi:hypothetical protein
MITHDTRDGMSVPLINASVIVENRLFVATLRNNAAATRGKTINSSMDYKSLPKNDNYT